MDSQPAESYLATAKPPPPIDFPSGSSIKVSIINCTAKITAPVAHFLNPPIKGHESLSGPCFSFLIEHSSGRKLLFDLGVRKDYEAFPPAIQRLITSPGWKLEIDKNVSEILQENSVDVAGGAIESIIWSHWHFDHTGDPATFPSSTSLIVGPGMADALLPGYPTNLESPLLDTDVAGRTVRTIDFTTNPLKIGSFDALDFFGDGSFYLLNVPGHAIGHMCGLARTTSTSAGDDEDTFVYMGADTAHHGGGFRPTEYLPLPTNIPIKSPSLQSFSGFCPGHLFQSIHPESSANTPFYNLNAAPSHDIAIAQQSCGTMQEFDALENVFIVIAHDSSLLGDDVGMPWFPEGTMREWRKQGLAVKGRWTFLNDFEGAVSKL